ncbi:MAG: glycosyltransferase family 4 protein [Deltaproteobacteria bacterium]
MKILIFQNSSAPYRIPLFERLSKKLNISIAFATVNAGDRFWSTNMKGFKHTILNGVNISIRGKIITICRGLYKYLKNNPFDVFIITDDLRCIISNLIIVHYAKKNKKKIILWCGEIESEFRRNNMIPGILRRISGRYQKYLVKSSHGFLAYGPKTVENYVKNYNAKREKFVWGTQGMDACEAEEVRTNRPLYSDNPDKEVVLLYLGYLKEGKGIETLITAVGKLKNRRYKLIIVGKGPYEGYLKLLAQNNKNIEFPGYIEGNQKKEFLLNADIMISPTYHDCWANTINEACLFGLPVITTEMEGAEGSLVINNYNAIVVKPGNVSQLQSAIEYLMDDNEMRQVMSERSREQMKKFNLDWVADNFIKAIELANGGK